MMSSTLSTWTRCPIGLVSMQTICQHSHIADSSDMFAEYVGTHICRPSVFSAYAFTAHRLVTLIACAPLQHAMFPKIYRSRRYARSHSRVNRSRHARSRWSSVDRDFCSSILCVWRNSAQTLAPSTCVCVCVRASI